MNTQATDKQQANFDDLCKLIDDMNILEDSFSSYFDTTDIDETTTASEIGYKLEDSGAFDIEIIYYSRAMDYLSKNDSSLQESLNLAAELGYTPENLSSEILASLHASDKARRDWYDNEDVIDGFLSGLDWEEPEDEEDEEDEDEEDEDEEDEDEEPDSP